MEWGVCFPGSKPITSTNNNNSLNISLMLPDKSQLLF